MTTAQASTSAMEYISAIDPAVSASFRNLRESVKKAGPLNQETFELIMASAFAVAGHERQLKTHVKRALAAGTSKAAFHHAIIILLGSVASVPTVARGLIWVDEAAADYEASR